MPIPGHTRVSPYTWVLATRPRPPRPGGDSGGGGGRDDD